MLNKLSYVIVLNMYDYHPHRTVVNIVMLDLPSASDVRLDASSGAQCLSNEAAPGSLVPGRMRA